MIDDKRVVDSGLIAVLSLFLAGFAYTAGHRGLWNGFVVCALAIAGLQAILYSRNRISLRAVVVLAVGARLALLPLPPVLSDDAYRYLWDGWLFVDGINPFRYLPSDPALAAYHASPLFDLMNSPDRPTIYPPVSQAVFAIGGLFVRSVSWEAGFYALKTVTTFIESLGLVLLARVIPLRNLMLLALCPVILIASAGQGHTDALLVGTLGMAYWAWKTDRPMLAVAFVTAAGWVKLVPLLFLPFLFRRVGLRAALLSGLLSILMWIPWAATWVPRVMSEALDLYVRYFEFNAGPYYFVKWVFRLFSGDDWSKQLGPFFRWLFLGGMAGLYWFDMRRWKRMPAGLFRLCLITMGWFLLTSTTIHPWYLVGMLVLIAIQERYSPHWQWLAAWSVGTYLLYRGGPYWTFVHVGWMGFVVLYFAFRKDELLQSALRWRARDKVALMTPGMDVLTGSSLVLDLGAAEGYVGREIAHQTGAEVHLMDVRASSRVPLAETVYDGVRIPRPDDSYDVVVLSFVLHHCEHPEVVLREAFRISRRRVIVLESVFETDRERARLRFMDRAANRFRSHGEMETDAGHLNHRRAVDWIKLAETLGARLAHRRDRVRPWHRQLMLVLDVSSRVDPASQREFQTG